MTPMLARVLIAVPLTLFGTAHACGQPGGTPKPEPMLPVTAGAAFGDARNDARSGPLADRLTVTVKGSEQSAMSANILLRIAPGVERDQRDAQVSIEAGQLRVYAKGGSKEHLGELIAVAASNPTAYYRVELETPPTPAALVAALPPLPLPTLAIFFAGEGHAVADPTPSTVGITWAATKVPENDLFPPITLNGTVAGKPGQAATIEFQRQQQRLRFRSLTAPLTTSGKDAKTINITAAWVDPGDPKSWTIDVAGRTRVDTLAALGTKIEPPTKKPDETSVKAEPAKAEPSKPETPPATQPKADPPSPPAAPPKSGPEP